MDIRTKLVFTLVTVALGSMLAIGTFSYRSARDLILDLRLAQLESLVETREAAIRELFDGWRDRARLIASRTQLRIRLASHNRGANPQDQEVILRILDDALESVTAVRQLAVYGWDDSLVAEVGRTGDAEPPTALPPQVGPESTSMYRSASVTADGDVLLTFLAAMRLDDATIGTLRMVIVAEELNQLTSNHRGLGETGETLIALDDDGGRPRILHPVRHPQAVETGGIGTVGDALLARALSGDRNVHTGAYPDYRGESVWAATRYLEEPGWGLVVKVDEDEHLAPIQALRRRTTELGISLSAFAILLGTILGLQFARPIHDLAQAAEEISEGNLGTRVTVTGQDEIAALARTFNHMAEGMERRVADLREFHTFFDRSMDLLCIAGTDGYFKRVNSAFERVLGWSRAELLNRPFVDFVHPDDVETTLAEVAHLAQGKPTVSFENRYRRADGSYTRLRWNTYPEPETGRLFAIAREVTDTEAQG